LTETSEATVCVDIVEDIAALARKLAGTEPYKSASGPDALLALATHLVEMVAGDEADDQVSQPGDIRVAVRKKKDQ
jgi:hypothetical protein